jgi:hypothetical protein
VPRPGRNYRVSLAWPRLPAAAEVAIVAAGYAGYALVRLAVRASHPAAVAHAAGLWRAERWLHLDIEPSLNHLAAARPVLAETAGYYYGLAHFIVTPLVLAWLWLRRPAAFGPLRSALVLATTAANVVFWTWPVAPPRFAVPGMTDILVRYGILGAGSPHGPDSLVNLYAAMPSLHVAWSAWCAAALVAATRGRRRHLAWLYPAATTLVVIATANHFLADAAAGLAVTALGLLATRAATRPDATGPGPGGTHPATALAAVIVYRVAGYWAPGAAGAITAAVLTRRHPAQAARPVTPPPGTGSSFCSPSPVSCTLALAAGSSPNRAARRRGAVLHAAPDARAARPWSAPGRPAHRPARLRPRAPPGSSRTSQRDGHRPLTQTKKGTCRGRHFALAGPPLTTRTMRVLTGGQDPHLGAPGGALSPARAPAADRQLRSTS